MAVWVFRIPAGWVGGGNGGKQQDVKGSGKWFYTYFWNFPSLLCSCNMAGLARYIVSSGELCIEPSCGLWDIDNALLMALEINSFSVIL